MPFGGGPGWMELLIVGVVALLLFGKRLPEVARSLGQGIVEFKNGMKGIENDVQTASYSAPSSRPAAEVEDEEETSAPKFEPPADS